MLASYIRRQGWVSLSPRGVVADGLEDRAGYLSAPWGGGVVDGLEERSGCPWALRV